MLSNLGFNKVSNSYWSELAGLIMIAITIGSLYLMPDIKTINTFGTTPFTRIIKLIGVFLYAVSFSCGVVFGGVLIKKSLKMFFSGISISIFIVLISLLVWGVMLIIGNIIF